MSTATFEVEGMHCEGCAARIERLLEREPAVVRASASFPEGRARVRYDPRAASTERLVEAIERGGFRVSRVGP